MNFEFPPGIDFRFERIDGASAKKAGVSTTPSQLKGLTQCG